METMGYKFAPGQLERLSANIAFLLIGLLVLQLLRSLQWLGRWVSGRTVGNQRGASVLSLMIFLAAIILIGIGWAVFDDMVLEQYRTTRVFKNLLGQEAEVYNVRAETRAEQVVHEQRAARLEQRRRVRRDSSLYNNSGQETLEVESGAIVLIRYESTAPVSVERFRDREHVLVCPLDERLECPGWGWMLKENLNDTPVSILWAQADPARSPTPQPTPATAVSSAVTSSVTAPSVVHARQDIFEGAQDILGDLSPGAVAPRDALAYRVRGRIYAVYVDNNVDYITEFGEVKDGHFVVGKQFHSRAGKKNELPVTGLPNMRVRFPQGGKKVQVTLVPIVGDPNG